MDYKEKYEQALERARQFSEKPYLEDSAGIVEYIFPELKESEDEKIRKELIEFVKSRGGFKQEYIAWLEKQGNKAKDWKPNIAISKNCKATILYHLNEQGIDVSWEDISSIEILNDSFHVFVKGHGEYLLFYKKF